MIPLVTLMVMMNPVTLICQFKKKTCCLETNPRTASTSYPEITHLLSLCRTLSLSLSLARTTCHRNRPAHDLTGYSTYIFLVSTPPHPTPLINKTTTSLNHPSHYKILSTPLEPVHPSQPPSHPIPYPSIFMSQKTYSSSKNN